MLLFLRRPPRLPPPSRPPASSRFLSNVFFPGRFWIVNSRDRCRTLYPVEQSINAPVTPDSYNYWREDMRQVRYAFDPAQLPDPPEYAQLAFLEPETKPNSPDLEHANPVHPPVMGVPWPTTFSHSLQAKGWFFTEGDLRRFIRETFFRDERVDHRRPREYAEHVVDSAMSFVANVFPTSLPKRLNMLARMYAVVFMHDGRSSVRVGHC